MRHAPRGAPTFVVASSMGVQLQMRATTWFLLAALGGSVVACSSNGGGGGGGTTDAGNGGTDTGNTPTDTGNTMVDAGPRTDTGNTMTDSGPATDRPSTDVPAVDAGPPYDPCMGAIDLNAMGMRSGETTRITSNNNMVGARNAIASSCGGTPGHQVAFRYVPRANTRLRISTDNAGTGNTFDTVVFAQSTCGMLTAGDGGTAGALGCDDDGGNDPRPASSSFSTTPVTMGQPVFIIVGGYLNTARMPLTGNVAQGAFELSVTEITSVAVGGTCDPTGAMNACAMGSTCVRAMPAATTGTCIADGARNGACRAGTTNRCDTGLECSLSVCRTAAMAGQACDGTTIVCVANTSCVVAAGMTMGTCVAAGAQGGRCRTDAPRCDTNLECASSGNCVRVVMAGQACDSGRTTTCTSGTSCINGTCIAAGTASGAPCRDMAPRCDTNLTCSTMTGAGTCQRMIAAGGACTPGSAGDICAANTACLPTSRTMGTCSMGTAEMEPNNSPMMPQAAPSGGRVYSGSVEAATGDAGVGGRDCFAVTVAQGQGIFAESHLPMTPACPSDGADPVIDIYNPMGTRITGADDTAGRGLCGTVNPATNTSAANLAAGTYTVCISGFEGDAVPNYLLTVAAVNAN